MPGGRCIVQDLSAREEGEMFGTGVKNCLGDGKAFVLSIALMTEHLTKPGYYETLSPSERASVHFWCQCSSPCLFFASALVPPESAWLLRDSMA
ncbi:hypothetical protein KC356_g305 [Hortaea werneckii]|nr:hypothetical protein KC356_g305 [Hortaea werneckii]